MGLGGSLDIGISPSHYEQISILHIIERLFMSAHTVNFRHGVFADHRNPNGKLHIQ